MFEGKTLAVIVPCRDEARQIARVLTTMPSWVDRIFVVDDGSKDRTASIVRGMATTDPRIELISHPTSGGAGRAAASGYERSKAQHFDITVVMAGDGQTDPTDLAQVVRPVADGRADYVKGSRFIHKDGVGRIPRLRRFGNYALSAVTRIVTGYWHISDAQCGYTALSRMGLNRLDITRLYSGYGYPNDLLARCAVARLRVAEVPVKPLYAVGESSKMRIPRVVLPILGVLSRGFARRWFANIVVGPGHPFAVALAFAAVFGAAAGVGALAFGVSAGVGVALCLACQTFLTALLFDFEASRTLCIHAKDEALLRQETEHAAQFSEATTRSKTRSESRSDARPGAWPEARSEAPRHEAPRHEARQEPRSEARGESRVSLDSLPSPG
ncbi:MAG: glycosyltransferase family 2 protein [Deltaproteobacteria bacterium]|nr:glycosyltransferase family 2 protein [Deltaproteobacteria bacterium]